MRNFYTYAPFARNSIDTLDQVEVLRGPSSGLYGQASNGGIINSVSKTPQFTAQGSARIEYGSWDHKQAVVDLTGPVDAAGTLAGRVVAVVRGAGKQPRGTKNERFPVGPDPRWAPGTRTEGRLPGQLGRTPGGERRGSIG